MLAGLIKTLLYILFFWYGFKLLAKIFAPFLMRYAANKVQEKFKKLVKKYHPDMNSGNKKYEEKLKIITLAYTQLKKTYRGKIDT